MDITDSGIKDVLIGAELFRALSITPDELYNSPQEFAKFKGITDYLNSHQDPLSVIGKIRNNKSPHMNNLEYLSGYVALSQEHEQLTKKAESIKKQLSYYDG